MRKNHLGQYVAAAGRIIVVPRFDSLGKQVGWTVHDLKTGKRRPVANLREAREKVARLGG